MNHLGDYDVIVIGAGHAGIEAAHAAAVLGAKTAVFTMSLDAIGNIGKGRKRTTNRAVSPAFQMVVLVYVRILPGQGGLPTFQIKSPLEIAALKRTLFAAGAFAGRSIV